MVFSASEAPSSKHLADSSLHLQRSLKTSVMLSGVALFTGQKVHLKLSPAPLGSGIVFRRTDLPGAPEVRALAENVKETPRSTVLEAGGVVIRSPEHILSALLGCQIDDAIIELDGEEPPVGDGSSSHFVQLIEQAGVRVLEEPRKVYTLDKPLYLVEENRQIIALPSSHFEISYTLSYAYPRLLQAQFYSGIIDEQSYKLEIRSSRTFSLHEEVQKMIEAGFLRSVTLDNGVVLKGDEVLNPEGLRFENEPVRHKVLDLIGDLALVGAPFAAHIISIRSGHRLNTEFAKLIRQQIAGRKK